MESMVVFYPCKDIEETSRFYQEVLGLRLYNDQGKCKFLTPATATWVFASTAMGSWQAMCVFRLIAKTKRRWIKPIHCFGIPPSTNVQSPSGTRNLRCIPFL